ncbi:hypothetical protein GQ43DRAFT_439462 [Delitschia confertaspora ATCC 74209]|uniref:18S rRNA factor 2 n=1 Tax=Delitschia confertaspora ATCC 74209 TaxID=1513339 RepID=A0A9P4JP99_9PLEO|nr:hypothetical protein GQ43DRAFT_439462 [Delitschia confertaspora ATCC 74209]
MTVRKRNEYLDAEESDSDDRGYDSAEESRATLLKSSKSSKKRQKLEHSPNAESDNDENAYSDHEHREDEDEDGNYKIPYDRDDVESRLPPVANSLLDTKTLKAAKLGKKLDLSKSKASKSGVIYISRVPPFMKPIVVRKLLSPYGEIGRIFLTPEDATQRSQRVKSGGSRRKLFLDGWVEFVSKKDAKFVAENLNAQIIGGKKRSRFHDEVWNIKYLKGLKWHHLVEQIANENAERAARMRFEIAQTTRENKIFLQNVERAKMLEGMERKKEEKMEHGGGEDGKGDGKGKKGRDTAEVKEQPRRVFKQNEVHTKAGKDGKSAKNEEVTRVLSKIF